MDLLYASMPFASSTTSSSFFSRYSVLVSELEAAEGERAFLLYQELIPLCASWQEALSRDIDRQDQESTAFLENISLEDCDASAMFVERYRETVDRLRSSVERLKAAIISTSEMATKQGEVVKRSYVFGGWLTVSYRLAPPDHSVWE
ncbi:hypothetical protein R1sor_005590 [Riccia sorocarpa]|uniref:Uncharacterized protein n=1 Tax=Riccia sorocarpa TaxID=122646 RepID=A0ABD3HRJ5_9MARC